MLDFFLLEGECQEHTHRRRAAQEKVKEPEKTPPRSGLSSKMKVSQPALRGLAQKRTRETPTGWWCGKKRKAERRRNIKECDTEKAERKQGRSPGNLEQYEADISQTGNPDLTVGREDNMTHTT